MGNNTKISYLYRDASNYKMFNECVIKGVLSAEQIQTILDCCNDEWFIPSKVGLPEKRFKKWTDDDHIWFEFDEWEDCFEETSEPANVDITCDELVASFERCKDNWEGQKFGKTVCEMIADAVDSVNAKDVGQGTSKNNVEFGKG